MMDHEEYLRNESELEAREYQIELFEKAIENNTIVSLKTGSGKTFIAVMLIKELQAEVKKSYSEGGKRTFFLVPKVPLVYQQAKAIEDHTALKVGMYHGEMNVDNWTLDHWNEELEMNEVVVMTPQVLLDMLNTAYITLDKINLLIFDECHAATGHHPYAQIMSRFKGCVKPPHVLGLTASIISKKCTPGKVGKMMRDLETVLHSHIETSSDFTSVNRHSTKPAVAVVEFGSCSVQCRDITSDLVNFLIKGRLFMESIHIEYKNKLNATLVKFETKSCGDDEHRNQMDMHCAWEDDADLSERMEFGSSPFSLVKNVITIVETLGLWCANHLCNIYLEDIRKLQEQAEEQFDECSANHFAVVSSLLMDVQATLTVHYEGTSTPDKMVDFVTPKVRRLVELLEAFQTKIKADTSNDPATQCSGLESFRGIVFVEQRIVAWMLAEFLQEISMTEDMGSCFRPCYIVGHGTCSAPEKKSAMKVNKQSETLRRFRTGSFNLMVATQVVEEGLDVPKCNVVVRFDLPKIFGSYVQSMGRARSEKAIYVLLVQAADLRNLLEDVMNFKKLEQVLQCKSHNRALPNTDELENFYKDHNKLPPYFTDGKDSAHVTMDSAISILYRYCNHLPHDRFTTLQPKFKYCISKTEGTSCLVNLPICCPISHTITGAVMANKSNAKKAVAYEACIQLHKAGELNNILEPVNYVERYQDKLGIVPMEPFNKGDPTPGTKKHRQLYNKMISADLKSSFPESGKNVYLYAVTIDDENGATNQSSFFGILSSKLINEVCPFKLFSKTCLSVGFKLMKVSHGLTKNQTALLETFHCFLFSNVLHAATSSMTYSPEKAMMSFLIAPLREIEDEEELSIIDWPLILRCAKYCDEEDGLQQPSAGKKSFEPGDVLLTQYEVPQRRFYVIEVCRSLSPSSPFPKTEYSTYANYFQSKYGACIRNVKQPLLLVSYAPNTLNLLLPLRNCATKQKIRASRLQHLIPELCRKFPLDIRRLNQAMCLPSILHRLNGLLVAHELKDRIVTDTNPSVSDAGVSTGPQLPKLESIYKDCRMHQDIICQPFSLGDCAMDSAHLDGLLFQALTTQSAANWNDLEKLEFIGDSFLKYSVSVFLFCQIRNVNEGVLTELRTGMVKNFTLYSHAKDRGIPNLLNASMFQPRIAWLPPCFIISPELSRALVTAAVPAHLWPHAKLRDCDSGLADNSEIWLIKLIERWQTSDPAHRERAAKQAQTSEVNRSVQSTPNAPDARPYDRYTQQLIGDKVVADSVEALIGAVLMCCGVHSALKFVDWLGLRVLPDSFPWEWPTTALLPQLSGQLTSQMLSAMYVGLEDLEAKLNYKFKDTSFLRQALVHPSYTRYPATDNYQRLEFLGDAILDYLVTVTMYDMDLDLSPGKMTDVRSALVDNVTFAYLAVKCGMHKFLRYSSSMLYQAIDRYVKHTETFTHPKDAAYMIKEADTLVLEEIEVPKVLGDMFEAIAGAIFLDSGLSLKAVWDVYYPIMKDVIEQYTAEVPISPVRMLLEKFPDAIFGDPIKEGDVYIVTVFCRGRKFVGCGKKKVPAKQAAAKCALNALKISATRRIE